MIASLLQDQPVLLDDAAARDAAHPNLAAVLEVLDLNGRPAAVQEWLTGLFSADWPHPCRSAAMALSAARFSGHQLRNRSPSGPTHVDAVLLTT